MLLEQLFDDISSTYTYLLADEVSREAIIIDPVADHLDRYLDLLNSKGLNLLAALDTHVHADHVTALGELRQHTGAETFLGKPGDISCADNALTDKQIISFGQYNIEVLFTPGHTDDSYCFLVKTDEQDHVFTGDTLLIGGSGRTDFQNGDAGMLYDSLHNILMALDDNTIVYPGHDYRGNTVSTIAKERETNQRLNIPNKDEFVEFMANLKLPNPKQMDVAVPANRSCGNPLKL